MVIVLSKRILSLIVLEITSQEVLKAKKNEEKFAKRLYFSTFCILRRFAHYF